jgi:hypothetical protein
MVPRASGVFLLLEGCGIVVEYETDHLKQLIKTWWFDGSTPAASTILRFPLRGKLRMACHVSIKNE